MLRLTMLLLLCTIGAPVSALTFFTENNPPMNFRVNGKITGSSTEVVTEMAKRAGLPVDIVMMSWNEGYARAKDGVDACIYSTVRRPDRFKLFQWVGPIGRGRYSAFSLEGFEPKLARVDDLKSFRIGVVDDARAAYMRQRGFPNLFTASVDTDNPPKLTLDPVKPGGIDIWVTQTLGAPAMAKEAGVKAIKEVFADILSQDYWLACNLQVPPETIRALTGALQDMQKDGSFKKLAEPTPYLAP